MNPRSTAERRIRTRRSASLPTMGLSLEELILLLEIAPRGWTQEEACGLVRRIAREICAKAVASGQIPEEATARWKGLATAADADIEREFCKDSQAADGIGDRVLTGAIGLLKHELAALRGR